MAANGACYRPVSARDVHQVKRYLLSCLMMQITGWSHILYKTVHFLLLKQEVSLWDAVNPSLAIFQTAAALEVLNVAIGLVKSGLVNTTFQVLSRLMVVWVNLYYAPPSRESYGLPLLLVAWSVTEIIRYSYYALGIVNKIPYFITWARYTFFYVLYPIGVTGEVLVVISCIPFGRDMKPLTMELPNNLNFTFSYHYFLYFSLLLYVLIFPSLYMHMINQRKKVLGKGTEKLTGKSKTK